MCKVSEKLKLCTCQTQKAEELSHYWILKRISPETMLVGEIALPAVIPAAHEMYNKTTLTKLLKDGNCFDIEINPREGDVLVLYFTCKSQVEFSERMIWHGDYLAYAFKYIRGTWRLLSFDPYAGGHELSKGEIKNAFIR